MGSSNNEILHDLSPLLLEYKDGGIERLMGEEVVSPSLDPTTKVQSKDVQFSPQQNVFARLYLPKNASSCRKLPILVYFHGGGFLTYYASSDIYQNYLNSLVAEADVIAVSVDYRLAPEYPLPIAHEDSWLALKWVASHSKGDGEEPWLNDYADFDRVYLGGDSAGANIAHNMAIRVGTKKLDGLNIDGMFLDCPYFWGKEPIGDEVEMSKYTVINKDLLERIWLYAYPTTTGLDDPLLNPAMDPKLSGLGCKRVLVYVAGKDVLKFRGWYYKELLEKSGWIGDVEVLEIEGEDHTFSVDNPTSENAASMLKNLSSFLNHKKP